jgi:uncharacterized protein YabE (DUF348 family)
MRKIIEPYRIHLFIGGLGLILYLVTLKPVFFRVAGSYLRVFTHGGTVAVAARDAGLGSLADIQTDPMPSDPAVWGMTIDVLTANRMEIDDHGDIRWVAAPLSDRLTASELLEYAGVDLAGSDWLAFDGVPVSDLLAVLPIPSTLTIRDRVPVIIRSDEGNRAENAVGFTVADALWQAGIRWRFGDRVLPAPDAPLEGNSADPMIISVEPIRPIRIAVDGGETELVSGGDSVGEALSAAGVSLTGMDYSVPEEADPIPSDGRIRVVRVREEYLREQEPIPFETLTQPSDELELDQQEWIQAGIPGVLEKTVRVRLEDGVEMSRFPAGERVLVPPQSRILGYGTKIVIRTVDTPEGPREYWRMITVYATSYSPCRLGVTPPRCGYVTYSGKHVDRGMIAMVVQWYNLFHQQQVYIPIYGLATVEDVGYPGPAFAPYWIDLFYLDDEWFNVHQYTTLYFLTPVPDNVPYLLR